MKKLALSLVVGAALAFTPLSSFALTPMSADTMKDATGQAGVSIAVDEIVLYQTIGETMYIDIDGDEGYANTDSAGVTISGKETFTRMNALLDGTARTGQKGQLTREYGTFLNGPDLSSTYGQDFLDAAQAVGSRHTKVVQTQIDDVDNPGTLVDAYWDGNDLVKDADNGLDPTDAGYIAYDIAYDSTYDRIEIAAISIDVSSAAATLTEINGTNTAAVVIGLPTIEIAKTGDIQAIGVWACDADGNKTANGGELIQIEKSDSVLTVLGGTLEIAAH